MEDVIHAASTKDTAPQDIRQQTARHGTLVNIIIVNGGGWGIYKLVHHHIPNT